MSKLPVEIIAEIIGNVVDSTEYDLEDPDRDSDPDERHTLVAASLVSRVWNSICRPYIFRVIYISTKGIENCLRFLHSEAPHISHFIHVVYFGSQWEHVPEITPAWYPQCLGSLKNLRALYLSYEVSKLLLRPGSLATGISLMIASPRLRKLVLRDWDFAKGGSVLLAALPTTLEELVLQEINVTSEFEAEPRSTPRLVALRSLELREVDDSVVRLEEFIDCPNLESLTARFHRYHPWDLPPWIPSSFSELVLHAMPGCDFPDFGTTVKPSAVTIYQSKDSTYLELFVWVRECIRRLPFPSYIRTFTLNVTNDQWPYEGPSEGPAEGLYPTPWEYEVLSDFLSQLHEEGGLEGINLNFTSSVDSPNPEYFLIYKAQELAKLKAAFETLIKGVLHLDFVVKPRRGGEIVMHCSIQRT